MTAKVDGAGALRPHPGALPNGEGDKWVGGVALTALGGLLLLLLTVARLSVPPSMYGDLHGEAEFHFINTVLAAGLVYAACIAIVRFRPVPRWALAVGLAAGLAARLVFVATPPVLSTDLYRYVWDGRVQRAGINPYRYVPADPALSFLRDGQSGPAAIFANINRPETARTIYPPVAQALFALIGWTASSIWTVKGVMLAFDLVAGAASWLLLRDAGRPESWLLVWALNPLLITEFAGAGHIDAAACAASALALLAAARGRPALAGLSIGVATLFKLLPAALAPAIWRPRTWRAPAAAIAVVAAGYAAYASVGAGVLGYLPGYAQEEHLESGGGYWLLRLLALAGPLPSWAGAAYVALSLVLLALLALTLVLRRGPPRADVITRDALLLSAALLLALSPHYPWYLTMLVVPAAVWPRFGVLWPTIVGPLLYLDGGVDAPWWPTIVFLPLLAWLGAALCRGIEHA